MELVWSVFSSAKSERAARKVYKWFQERLGCEVLDVSFAPYPKTGGWTFTGTTPLNGATWNDQVVEALGLGQCVGYMWTLTGNVRYRLSGWSNQPSVSGVTAIEWQLWAEAAGGE